MMVNKMIFADLIDDYAVPFQYISGGGKYVDGEWISDADIGVTKYGAIIPFSNKEIFNSGGKYTSSDRQLAIAEKLELGAKVVDGSETYTITSEDPYADHYADTNIYHLKAVSVFD